YSGLILVADRTEGRRKRLSTVLVERDQALIDAQTAFGATPSTTPGSTAGTTPGTTNGDDNER
ncbi:MAG: hypothetical protein H7146_00590, partial [Burkholderiaceae bacterium]|nr:hypothetical protein [Microbacteriaceae bacterium]